MYSVGVGVWVYIHVCRLFHTNTVYSLFTLCTDVGFIGRFEFIMLCTYVDLCVNS